MTDATGYGQAPPTAAERAAIRASEHDCDCEVCDELVWRYEATLAAAEQRATRLEAVARRTIQRGSVVLYVEDWDALDAAVAALAGPAGEAG